MTRRTAFERLVDYLFPDFYVERILTLFQERIEEMALDVQALRDQVSLTETVHQSTIALLHKLTGELSEISAKLAATPPQEPVDTKPLDDLVSQLKASTDDLAKAVANSSDVYDPIFSNNNGN